MSHWIVHNMALPSGHLQFAFENGPVEIAGFPINSVVIVQSCVYFRYICFPEGTPKGGLSFA